MKTDSIKIKDLFQLEKRYVVPIFQRPYVWKREEQWEPLWDDIRSIAKRLLTDDATPPHFIGAVVLDQKQTKTTEIEARLVIDGQQRLTTLQLLLAAARDVCSTLGIEDTARKLRGLTANREAPREYPEQRFKVWPTNVDQGQFAAVMDLDATRTPEEKVEQAEASASGSAQIVGAYRYFAGVIKEWITDGGADEQQKRADALYYSLGTHVYLVVIDLGHDDDAQVIFETLNARGTPLLPIDLVKNYLFSEAGSHEPDLNKFYTQYWQAFDEQSGFWRKMVGRGHAQRPRVDLYLQHYLSMVTGEEVGTSHIFASYKRASGVISDQRPEGHMRELHQYAQIYRQFEDESKSTPRGEFFYRLKTMDVTTAYPLLLHLCARKDLAEEQRLQVFADVESFLVRRMICRLSTRGYNRLFLDLLGVAKSAPDCAASIRQWLLEQTAEYNRWPTDEEFEEGWISLQPYRELVRARLRMVLEALEAQLRSDNSEDIALRGKLQIEHLMPQAWQDHWPLSAGADPATAKASREDSIHRFGNLTLLTKKLNPRVSNGGWDKKRPEILTHSALALNRQLHDKTIWDEERIAERSRALLEVALRAWPRPSA